MKDEFSDRHQAIKLRLAGQSVESICQTLGRSREWFHTWWRRYQALGADGLFDTTRARNQPALISPDLERTILAIRKRLESSYHPQTRCALIGASAIQAELQALHIRPIPCARTIERVLQRNGATLPKVRLARYLPEHVYPAPQAQDSNHLRQVDLVGPIYLKGQRQRYYIYVCKDVFDGAICLKLGRSRPMEAVLGFLGDCWKTLGRPKQVQFDNAREYLGWGPAARYLARVIRLCLRFEVEPIFIPSARPQRNGSVENFNGWFQPRLLQRHFTRVSALQRELQRLQDTVNTQHVQRRLGGLTPEQYRRRKKPQKLPARYVVPTEPLPIAAGRATFIRQVTTHGTIHLLSQTYRVGKRLKGQYVKAVLDTQRAQLTVYVKGRIFKRWPYPFLRKEPTSIPHPCRFPHTFCQDLAVGDETIFGVSDVLSVRKYLLRNVPISHSNQVWGIDITYIRLHAGWLYLVAVLDWFSRYVLSGELDQTLEMPVVLTAVQGGRSILNLPLFVS